MNIYNTMHGCFQELKLLFHTLSTALTQNWFHQAMKTIFCWVGESNFELKSHSYKMKSCLHCFTTFSFLFSMQFIFHQAFASDWVFFHLSEFSCSVEVSSHSWTGLFFCLSKLVWVTAAVAFVLWSCLCGFQTEELFHPNIWIQFNLVAQTGYTGIYNLQNSYRQKPQ